MPAGHDVALARDCKATARWLHRLRLQSAHPGDSVDSLLAFFDDLPTPGPLAACAEGLAPDYFYYRAAPVHLRADRDRVLLFGLDRRRINAAEALEIANSFNELYQGSDFQLQVFNGHWTLRTSGPIGPELPELAAVTGRYLDTALGADLKGRPWRQLLNETQMLLHEHPVNQARAANDVPVINGLWFWGGGYYLPPEQPPVIQRVIADNPLGRGIARYTQAQWYSADPSHLAECDRDSTTLVVLDRAENAMNAADIGAWEEAVRDFDVRWATPLEQVAKRCGGRMALLTGGSRQFVPKSGWLPHWPSGRRDLSHWIETL